MIDEFDFIKSIIKRQGGTPSDGVLAIGDDCSAIPFGASLFQVTSTDCLVENIHFRTSTTSFEALGWKALAVNLSDIAAMGGRPQYCHLSVAVPAALETSSVDGFLSGFFEAADQYGVHLLGGDMSGSESTIFINIVVSGVVEKDQMKTRKGFQPGCDLLLAGNLGASALGLLLLESGRSKFSENEDIFIENHRRPIPLVELGTWLATQNAVKGMMDTSDGIHSTLLQLQKFLGVGFSVQCEGLKATPEFRNVCNEFKKKPLDIMLNGGEDYGLLISIEKGMRLEFEKLFLEKFAIPLNYLGEVRTNGLSYFQGREELKLENREFQHFSKN